MATVQNELLDRAESRSTRCGPYCSRIAKTCRWIDPQVLVKISGLFPESRLTEEDNTDRRKGLNIPRQSQAVTHTFGVETPKRRRPGASASARISPAAHLTLAPN